MIEEIWLPVVGHEASYQVSSHGRVRSVDRVVMKRRGHGPAPDAMIAHHVKGYMLRLGINSRGYVVAGLSGKSRAVHWIVLETFVGPCPPHNQALHWDGNQTNNFLSNLRWGTSSENHEDMRRHGTLPIGEDHGRAVLTEANVIFIRANPHISNSAFADQFGVASTTIQAARDGRNWAHLQVAA